MKNLSYADGMGDDGAHIRLKLNNSQPILLSDFVGEFVGIGNQFEKFVAREYPGLKGESKFFVKEVRAGSIEADFVAWIVGSGILAAGGVALSAIDAIDKIQIMTRFVGDFSEKLGAYFKPGGRAKGVTKSDLIDFLKTTEAIANDPNGSANLEAAVYEDQERKVRAAFKFTTAQARHAGLEITEHRRELEERTDQNQERVLLRFVRPSVEAGKPGKKGGERGVIESIARRALPILYASSLAEQRMLHEKMQLEGNVFRALFDVSVNVELSPTNKPVAYRIMDVHTVITEDDDDLFED